MKTLILVLASCLVVVLLGLKPVIAQNSTKSVNEIKIQNTLYEFTRSDIPTHCLYSNFYLKKYLFTSDVLKQKLDSIIEKEWNESEWVNDGKEEFKYDSKGNNISWTILGWNGSNNCWQNSWKIEAGFDNSGNPIVFINYEWDENTHQWFETEKTEITYDVSGNMTIGIEFEWDEDEGQWVAVYKEENTYGEDGKIIFTFSFEWNEITNQWENSSKVDYTYDNSGNEIMQIIYGWDEQWVGAEKTESEYDATGNLTVEIFSFWDNNQWQKEYKSMYTYNADNKPTLETGHYWSGGQWEPESKNEKTYDVNGNKIMQIRYYWDGNSSQFIPYSKNELTYNLNYSFDELLLPWFFYLYEMNLGSNMLTNENRFHYDEDAMLWVAEESDSYYYSETDIDAITNQTISKIKLYPNPSIDYITICWEDNYSEMDLEIFDVMGSLILNKQICNNITISLDYLAKGMYFYRIVDSNKEIQSGKIIIK